MFVERPGLDLCLWRGQVWTFEVFVERSGLDLRSVCGEGRFAGCVLDFGECFVLSSLRSEQPSVRAGGPVVCNVLLILMM